MLERVFHVAGNETPWSRLSDALGAQMGLHYPRERWGDLERGIRAAVPAFGMASIDACVDWLLSAPLSRHQIEVLASCLTVGETYFFREKRSFDVLREHILPDLLRQRQSSERRLRIWSAGCCTGEEPYSIAILLAGMIPDLRSWNISILATDIDPNFLRKASSGVYSEWSFRDSLPGIKSSYFRKTQEGRYEIAPRIKDLVTFSYLNLAEDTYPSVANGTNAMDIVFCRNVLMYFEPAHANRVLQRLGWSLVEDGWLFLNPVEIPHAALPQLAPVHFGDVIVHRKTSAPFVVERSVAEYVSLESMRVPTTPEWLRGTPETPLQDKTPFTRRARDQPAATVTTQRRPATREQNAEPATPSATPHQEAATAYKEGRYAEAVQGILGILANAPDDPAATALLARTYANQGRLAEALQCCERAIAGDKLNAGWRHLMATILQELGRPEEATEAFRRALYLDQNNALVHFALGNLLRRQGHTEDGRRHLRNALALLNACQPDQIVPESEGISAGRLAEIIRLTALAGDEP